MATHLEHSWTLPADPEAVFAMFVDERYQRATGDASGATAVTVTIETSGGKPLVRSVRTLPTNDVPAPLRAFVGESLDIAIEQRWGAAGADGARSATTGMTALGKPLDFTGSCALTPGTDGTEVRISGDLACSLPFVGGRVEQAVAPVILDAFRIEEQQGLEYLAAR